MPCGAWLLLVNVSHAMRSLIKHARTKRKQPISCHARHGAVFAGRGGCPLAEVQAAARRAPLRPAATGAVAASRRRCPPTACHDGRQLAPCPRGGGEGRCGATPRGGPARASGGSRIAESAPSARPAVGQPVPLPPCPKQPHWTSLTPSRRSDISPTKRP
jgi:hypothetical protein